MGALSLAWLGACTPLPPPQSAASSGERQLLTPWRTISGAWRSIEPGQAPSRVQGAINADRIQLQYPVGVAARGNDVYIADAGLHHILRYDRARETLSVFAPFPGLSADQAAGLYVASDQSLYVANPSERRVVHYDRLGRVRQSFADESNLSRPFAVLAMEPLGEVWVGDSLSNQVVVFSGLGRGLRLLNMGGDAPLRRLGAMTIGPDGLYLCDRSARKVAVLAPDGTQTYELREGLTQPRAIAVDGANRVFVAEGTDDTIKVFAAGKLIASFGGSGSSQSRYSGITALAVDENLLYVADSLNARVQILLVGP